MYLIFRGVLRRICWTLLLVFVWLVVFAGEVTSYNYQCDLECKMPQPRAVVAWEFFNLSNIGTQPHMVVVHRCDNSGCCAKGSICVASADKTIEIIILEKWNAKYRPTVQHFQNHTQCCCREVGSNTIK